MCNTIDSNYVLACGDTLGLDGTEIVVSLNNFLSRGKNLRRWEIKNKSPNCITTIIHLLGHKLYSFQILLTTNKVDLKYCDKISFYLFYNNRYKVNTVYLHL